MWTRESIWIYFPQQNERETCGCIVCFGSVIPSFPSKRRIRIVGGVCSGWAGASLRRCTLQQSGKLPNKQMKSTHRHFPLPPQMWLQQMQSWHWRLTQCDNLLCLHSQIHFDLFSGKKRRKRRGRSGVDTVHMITHEIMFVSSNSSVTI